ncbi:acetyltransferase [Sodiomyces alkalinus F11]|uniref:Acetyltransferase n=1 Tax=Sodiomyces alkalinus (strain CBS 110278 / VKM F-3762 / F11) TaxID=1314773 RepID=A0A3N2Q4X1_SODAK|nr:acetyltransferase [Sodiomyces alkalinus F11]ROT41824.1 acetyltransferase [Sodiomyces alkalinus F11]
MEDAVRKPDNLSTLLDKRRPSLVPPSWEDTVRVIGMAECKEAGLSLAHAFAADHLSQYLLDADDMAAYPPERKWKLHVDIMTYITASHCCAGIATTIGPDHDSIALWLPPGGDMDDWWTFLRSGTWRLYYQFTAQGRQRYYGEFLPLLHDTKHEVMGERDNDCYYLVYIGTKPNARGKGYASKLIQDMITRADAENRAMYLESCSEAHNAYYAKFGFEFKKNIHFGGGSTPVTLSIMVREPQPPRNVVYTAAVKVQINSVNKEGARLA